jgi:hypothetical protein
MGFSMEAGFSPPAYVLPTRNSSGMSAPDDVYLAKRDASFDFEQFGPFTPYCYRVSGYLNDAAVSGRTSRKASAPTTLTPATTGNAAQRSDFPAARPSTNGPGAPGRASREHDAQEAAAERMLRARGGERGRHRHRRPHDGAEQENQPASRSATGGITTVAARITIDEAMRPTPSHRRSTASASVPRPARRGRPPEQDEEHAVGERRGQARFVDEGRGCNGPDGPDLGGDGEIGDESDHHPPLERDRDCA